MFNLHLTYNLERLMSYINHKLSAACILVLANTKNNDTKNILFDFLLAANVVQSKNHEIV